MFLTRLGQSLIARIRDSVSVTEKEILEKIDEADLRATGRALRLMKENLLAMIVEGEESDATDAA